MTSLLDIETPWGPLVEGRARESQNGLMDQNSTLDQSLAPQNRQGCYVGPLSSVGAKGAENGCKERLICRPLHSDVQILRILNPSKMDGGGVLNGRCMITKNLEVQ